eukprot:UN14545
MGIPTVIVLLQDIEEKVEDAIDDFDFEEVKDILERRVKYIHFIQSVFLSFTAYQLVFSVRIDDNMWECMIYMSTFIF